MPFSGPLGERQLISELIADYCDAVNRRDDVAWGATWDEDSVWSLPFLGIEGIRGRANIVSTWKQAMGLFSFAHMMAQGGCTPKNGEAFRKEILSRGSSRDPMKSYKAFRGTEPTVDALLIRRGLK